MKSQRNSSLYILPLILMPIHLVKTEQIDRRQHQIEIGELVNEESELAIP